MHGLFPAVVLLVLLFLLLTLLRLLDQGQLQGVNDIVLLLLVLLTLDYDLLDELVLLTGRVQTLLRQNEFAEWLGVLGVRLAALLFVALLVV